MINYLELIYLLVILVIYLLLPGILILGIFNDAEDKKALFPLIPVLSMSVNGIIFWLLYSWGIYTRFSVIIFLFIYLLVFYKTSDKILYRKTKYILKITPVINKFIVLCISIVLIYYMIASLSFPFMDWDAVVSWNRWAMHMGLNSSVGNENFYGLVFPQLLPATYSLLYKLNIFDNSYLLSLGQYVNHLLTVFFTFNIFWILLEYAKLRKIYILFPALILISHISYMMWVPAGYADIFSGLFVIAFFYLLDIYYLKRQYFDEKYKKFLSLFCVLSIISAAAAFAKQPALILIPIFLYILVREFFRKKFVRRNILYMFIILLPVYIVSSFYISQFKKNEKNIREFQIMISKEINTVDNFNSMYHEYTGIDNDLQKIDILTKIKLFYYDYCRSFFINGKKMSNGSIRIKLVEILILISIGFGMLYKTDRLKSIFLLVWFFIWVYNGGYGIRHMFMIHPLIAFVAAVFLNNILTLGSRSSYNRLLVIILLVILAGKNNVYVINNNIFYMPKNLNFKNINADKEERYRIAYPAEANLINIMKKSEYYETGDKIYAKCQGFYKYHPDASYLSNNKPSISEIPSGSYFCTTISDLAETDNRVWFIGNGSGWSIYKVKKDL